jgi:hypothetical protein
MNTQILKEMYSLCTNSAPSYTSYYINKEMFRKREIYLDANM